MLTDDTKMQIPDSQREPRALPSTGGSITGVRDREGPVGPRRQGAGPQVSATPCGRAFHCQRPRAHEDNRMLARCICFVIKRPHL